MKTLTDWFNAINEHDLHPSQLIQQLAQQLNISDSPLYRTGLRIGYEADKGSKEVSSYHNYIHTSEAMASMYEMASIEFKDIPPLEVERLGLSRKEELVFLAVTVMAAHDLYHDGKDKAVTNPSKELEAQSARAATAIAFQEGVSRPIIDTLQRAIEATIVDPDLNDMTHTAYHANRHDAVAAISQMATESDLAASISPTWGPTKGELLAHEVEKAGNTARFSHDSASQKISVTVRQMFSADPAGSGQNPGFLLRRSPLSRCAACWPCEAVLMNPAPLSN